MQWSTHDCLQFTQKGNRVEFALDAQSPMESDPCVHSDLPALRILALLVCQSSGG